MQCLNKTEARTVRAIGQTFYPRGNELGIDGIDAGVTDYIDGYLAKLAVWERTKVRALFWAIEYAPAAAAMDKSRRFSSANLEERLEYLNAWESSSLHLRRMAFKALRYLLGLAYVSSGAVAAEIGIRDDEDLGDPEEHLRQLAQADLGDLGAAE